MDLGFSGDLAMVTMAAATLTKVLLYPLAQLRRRVDSDGDGQADDVARGMFYVHPDLQGPLVLIAVVLLALVFALFAVQPIIPVITAAWVGMSAAEKAHEAGLRKK